MILASAPAGDVEEDDRILGFSSLPADWMTLRVSEPAQVGHEWIEFPRPRRVFLPGFEIDDDWTRAVLVLVLIITNPRLSGDQRGNPRLADHLALPEPPDFHNEPYASLGARLLSWIEQERNALVVTSSSAATAVSKVHRRRADRRGPQRP